MPSELRQIVFSHQEVIDAIIAYDKTIERDKIPAGLIENWRVLDTKNVALELKMTDAKGAPVVYQVSPSFVGAALIAACIESRIPMPRKAHKSLQVLAEGIALMLRIGGAHEDLRKPGAKRPEPAGAAPKPDAKTARVWQPEDAKKPR